MLLLNILAKVPIALAATGKGTICNMGAEIGATASLFGYDEKMAAYLRGYQPCRYCRHWQMALKNTYAADDEVYANPEQYFDQVIEINLNELEPHVNGPFTPDLAWPISKFADSC